MLLYMSGNLLVLAAALLWSLSGVLIRSVDVSVTWVILIRAVSAAIFLFPFFMKARITQKKELIWTGISFAMFMFLFSMTTRVANSVFAVSMQYAAPLYLILYTVWQERRIDWQKLPIFLLLLIGILCNLWGSMREVSGLTLFLGLFVGVFFIFYTIGFQKITDTNPLGTVGGVNIIASLIFLLMLPFDYEPLPSSGEDLFVLVMAGIFISGVSYIIYVKGVQKTTLEGTMMVALAEPIFNPIWVFLGIGEYPSFLTFIGLFFILIGAVWNILLLTRED